MVRSYPEGNKINFSELARHYGVKNNNNEFLKNGGQIVKMFLQENGINFDSLNYKNKSAAVHFRRKERKIDGINVSIPTDVANTEVKEYLAKLINEGAYTIGDLIVPQKFEKLILNADLTTEIKEFEIAGRKVPLSEIRKKQYINNKQFYRIFTESQIKELDREELVKELRRIDEFSKSDIYMDINTLLQRFRKFNTTRNLQFWHDGSSISNHSHLLITVNTLYDKTIHMTNQEYEEKHKKKVDVQSEIEKHHIYILARCPGDDHQLMYSDCRNEDIRGLKYPTDADGCELNDVAHFFHGDGPACQLEAGQQKNGRYPCWVCPANFDFGNDLAHMYSLPHLSLADRMQKIIQSECSETKIKEGKTKLYKNLQKHEIIDELHQRGISFWSQDKKANLEDKLINEMHGMKRFPSLMQADQTITSMLEHYEILGCEPLHDVKHHIENMYVELPHLNKTEKRLVEETIQLSLERKEIKRRIDYRKSLIKLNVSL